MLAPKSFSGVRRRRTLCGDRRALMPMTVHSAIRGPTLQREARRPINRRSILSEMSTHFVENTLPSNFSCWREGRRQMTDPQWVEDEDWELDWANGEPEPEITYSEAVKVLRNIALA